MVEVERCSPSLSQSRRSTYERQEKMSIKCENKSHASELQARKRDAFTLAPRQSSRHLSYHGVFLVNIYITRVRRPHLLRKSALYARKSLAGSLDLFTGASAQLRRFPQVAHHLIDLSLKGVHLAGGLDGDEAREVTVHGCSADLREGTYLLRQISRHRVNSHPKIRIFFGNKSITHNCEAANNVKNIRDFLPCALNILDFSLNTKLAFHSDRPSDLGHLRGEEGKLVNHTVDGRNQV